MNSMVKSQDKKDSSLFKTLLMGANAIISTAVTSSQHKTFGHVLPKNQAFKKTCRIQEWRKQVPFSQGGSVWYASVPAHLRFVYLKQVQEKISPLA